MGGGPSAVPAAKRGRMTLRSRRNTIRVAVLIVLACPLAASAATNDLQALDGLVARWMALRTTIAEERRAWEAREEQWQDEIRLLETESAALQQDLDRREATAETVRQDLDNAVRRKTVLAAEHAVLRDVLGRAEAGLLQWRGRIPDGLRSLPGLDFDALPETPAQAAEQPLTQRARAVATLYAGIESLQNTFHTTHEMLAVGDVRRRVDVLYIGLAQGFAVTTTDDWAAVGRPAVDGWAWDAAQVAPAAVRTAIDMVDGQATARLVTLPLHVTGEGWP